MTTGELLHIQPPHDTHGFAELAPALVVEVLSPDDRLGEVLARCSRGAREVLAMCAGWLRAGCRLVWVVDPERRVVRAYRADGSVAVVGEVLA